MSFWRDAAEGFYKLIKQPVSICVSPSFSVSLFTLFSQWWLETLWRCTRSPKKKKKKDISDQELPTPRGQTSSPTFFHFRVSLGSLCPFHSPPSSIIISIFFYLILSRYSHLPLSVNYVLSLPLILLLSDPTVSDFQSLTPSVSLHTILQAWQQNGQSDALLQVAVTLLC